MCSTHPFLLLNAAEHVPSLGTPLCYPPLCPSVPLSKGLSVPPIVNTICLPFKGSISEPLEFQYFRPFLSSPPPPCPFTPGPLGMQNPVTPLVFIAVLPDVV
jgi:hypothetical protein